MTVDQQKHLRAVARARGRVRAATEKAEREGDARRVAVIDACMAGVAIQVVADAAGVSRQTIHAWASAGVR